MRTTIIHLDSDSKCQACISPPHVRLPTDFDSDRRVMALDVAIMIFFHNAQGRNMRHSRYDEQECRMTFVRDLDCREACSCTMSLLIWLCRFHKFLPHNSTATRSVVSLSQVQRHSQSLHHDRSLESIAENFHAYSIHGFSAISVARSFPAIPESLPPRTPSSTVRTVVWTDFHNP